MTDVIAEFYTDSYDQAQKLMSDILEHQYFSFELKKIVFLKALRANWPEKSKLISKGKLTRLQQLRNIAAHASIAVESMDDHQNIDMIIFSYQGRNHKALKVLNEYNELKDQIEPLLVSLVDSDNIQDGPGNWRKR